MFPLFVTAYWLFAVGWRIIAISRTTVNGVRKNFPVQQPGFYKTTVFNRERNLQIIVAQRECESGGKTGQKIYFTARGVSGVLHPSIS